MRIDGRRIRLIAVILLLAVFAAELILAGPSLAAAFRELRAPRPGWVALALLTEIAAMHAYARMQRRVLRSAGVRAPLYRHAALAYAAHSLNETLPGGPAFSTRFNYQQMRRFGASPAVASWAIALSGILSATALAAVTAGAALAGQGRPSWSGLAGLGALVVLLTLGVRQVARRPERVEATAGAVLARLNRLRRRDAAAGLGRITGFLRQLGAARLTPGNAAAAGTYAVLNWLLDAVCLWLCWQAVGGGGISGTRLLLAFCAGYAAGTITIVPGGLGIIDSALILGLLAGGAGTSTAIATVVLYRIISFGFIVGAGWVAWSVMRRDTRSVPEQPDPGPGQGDAPLAALVGDVR
ncbi:YbhN family protein [Actinoplanes oblitus]|uniref:YbhN family protein n=1 Tax=Actinoplanes oblitus TaxID=3040509 RepID=A0ABY8W7Z9_9ACTN|nr:YbhN family protein [Actinoplanes oblitus]WIM93132.1 YbhN family protein [Actinoplanes oblitus]